jgi:hypothetical protein
MEVPAVYTPVSELDLISTLHDGHIKAFDSEPSVERLGFAWAQMCLEMGRGKLIRCFNYGNITATPSWTGDFFSLHVPPPDPPVLKFRAFKSAILGATNYWSFMAQRFAQELELMNSGNAFLTAERLGEAHYYLADKQVYSKAVANLYQEFMQRLAGKATASVPSPEELALMGTLWHLEDQLDQGEYGIDAIDKVVKGS